MTEQQTPASVVEGEPLSNPQRFADEIAWLLEAARYFASRSTGGEDRAHWANVYNAENANKAAALIERLSAEREGLREVLTDLTRDCIASDFNECWDSYTSARAALTQGESRQTLPAAPTPADGGGE